MPTWVGIDIGTSAVKVAVLRTSYRRMSIDSLSLADIGESGGVVSAIQLALSAAMGGPPSAGDGASIGLDGMRVAIRNVTLPAGAAKQVGEVLPFELEATLPYEMSESVFDYRILERPSPIEGEADKTITVLAAVARTADVRERIDLLKEAIGVEPARVGVGLFPLANTVQVNPPLGEEGPIVIIDLGTRSSDLLILDRGDAVFARSISFGTAGLPGTAPKLAREIRMTIAAFRSAGGPLPNRVYLCGGGAFVSGAESFLSAELEVPVGTLPPPMIDFGAAAEVRLSELPRFAKAIGLAMGLGARPIGFNLRRGVLAYERGFGWVKEKIPVLATLGTIILVSFAFSTWAELFALSKQQSNYEKALSTVTAEVLNEATTSPARANELLNQQTALGDEDPMPHVDAFDVMVKLSEAIPASMVSDIEEFDVQKGHAVIHGIVGTIPDAQAIAATLANEKCFSDVKITRTNQVVGGDKQKYVLELDLKCPDESKKKSAKPSGSSSSAPSATDVGGK